ncbi:MAG: hypothetical protein IPH62_10665 [Ignavibacteriae bacterium]|nr:hypothetical protein [Ignavibacteriota bacterium]
MGGNHIILVIGAVVLTATLIVNSTKQINSSSERTAEAGKITTAISIGQKFIKEISSKSFDENCIASIPTDSTGFSNLLKSDGNEVYNTFDDVDDFNNYQTTVNNDMGAYNLKVGVSYVRSINLEYKSTIPTRTKKISVYVSSISLIDTVKLYYYTAY